MGLWFMVIACLLNNTETRIGYLLAQLKRCPTKFTVLT